MTAGGVIDTNDGRLSVMHDLIKWLPAMLALSVCWFWPLALSAENPYLEMTSQVLRDKIHGGFLGQLLGNLNGLPHEFAYIDEPGNVSAYIPGFEYAYTDDDTDVEWVYVIEMERGGETLIPYGRIAELWLRHLNRGIFASNQWARGLIGFGIVPPMTSHPALNPRAHYNIAGQFNTEAFGLMAPGMPQTAARIGSHYARVVVDGEPVQAAQLYTTMIATAFLSADLDEIIDAGVGAVDPESQIRQIVAQVRRWHIAHPDDWHRTRALIKERYASYPGGGNGYGLITACTIAALLYGGGDFTSTLTHAFNFGWDADNVAATAGTIIGAIKGRTWFESQGWELGEEYRNISRDHMPTDETVSRYADRIVTLAERIIIENGGSRIAEHDGAVYRIALQSPANVLPLVDTTSRARAYREAVLERLETDIYSDREDIRRKAVLDALISGLTGELMARHADQLHKARIDFQKWMVTVQDVGARMLFHDIMTGMAAASMGDATTD
jgi:hypothetical protein